jgi:transposase InsO family protein
MTQLASDYGRYGYRRVTALLRGERWRGHYNTVRPHSSLGYQPPAPEAIQPRSLASATPQRASGAGQEAASTRT